MPKLLLFTSAVGGAGKSQIVSNLAYALTKLGNKVLIIDLNKDSHLRHLSNGLLEIYDYARSFNADQFLKQLPSLKYDFIIADAPGDCSYPYNPDQIFIVLTPSPQAILRSVEWLKHLPMRGKSLFFVLNKVGESKTREISGKKVRQIIENEGIFEVPYDESVLTSERLCELVTKKYPYAAFSLAIMRMATVTGGAFYCPPPRCGVFTRLKRKLSSILEVL